MHVHSKIHEIIRTHKRFIIAGHVSPDADAIGACFALALALHKLGKDVSVLLDAYPEKYQIIPGAHFLWKAAPEAAAADVFIAVDCGDAARLGAARACFDRTAITVCIDHHDTNAGFAQHNLIEAGASSTCEMLYDLMAPMVDIDADIAAALYAGIVTDTGGFRFDSTGAATLIKVASLVSTGIPYTKIYNTLLHIREFPALKAMGTVFNNARQHGRIIYSTITLAELREINATHDDLEGVAKFLICTHGAEIALFAYEGDHPGEVKVGLRSQGFHVGKFARQWGGGGHRLAAGCTVLRPIESVVSDMLAALERELTV